MKSEVHVRVPFLRKMPCVCGALAGAGKATDAVQLSPVHARATVGARYA